MPPSGVAAPCMAGATCSASFVTDLARITFICELSPTEGDCGDSGLSIPADDVGFARDPAHRESDRRKIRRMHPRAGAAPACYNAETLVAAAFDKY